MPQFHYQATTPQGKVIEGVMEAGEERVVVSRLHEQGYLPLRIVLPGQAKPRVALSRFSLPALPGRGTVRQRDLLIWSQELATLISAGSLTSSCNAWLNIWSARSRCKTRSRPP